jgi:hypothetical protein
MSVMEGVVLDALKVVQRLAFTLDPRPADMDPSEGAVLDGVVVYALQVVNRMASALNDRREGSTTTRAPLPREPLTREPDSDLPRTPTIANL